MTSATYQTKVPAKLIPLCEVMAALMPKIERNLYRELEAGREEVADLKREYQRVYGINARQFRVFAFPTGNQTLIGRCKIRKQLVIALPVRRGSGICSLRLIVLKCPISHTGAMECLVLT